MLSTSVLVFGSSAAVRFGRPEVGSGGPSTWAVEEVGSGGRSTWSVEEVGSGGRSTWAVEEVGSGRRSTWAVEEVGSGGPYAVSIDLLHMLRIPLTKCALRIKHMYMTTSSQTKHVPLHRKQHGNLVSLLFLQMDIFVGRSLF